MKSRFSFRADRGIVEAMSLDFAAPRTRAAAARPLGPASARSPHRGLSPEQTAAPYASALSLHAQRDTLSLLVPGHGAAGTGIAQGQADYFGERLLALDVPPLLEGIDLGPGSPKQRALELAAEAWGARRTWFLTNGSSQANRIAAIAARGLGDDVVMQRSAHSSFVDGILVAGLRPGFATPAIDRARGIHHGLTPDAVRAAIEAHPGAPRAVYIVSPSYFGAVADVAGIAEVVHAAGAALIVDGAWGAHFGFHPELPESPLRLGADLAIMSTHKLTGSLTQSAVLHLGETALADRLEPLVERAHAMTASTSESSLMMASIDLARRDLVSRSDDIDDSVRAVRQARQMFRADGRFPIISDGFGEYDDIVAVDPFRIPLDITATGLDGHAVRERLMREHGVLTEIATATAIVAVVGIGKSPELSPLLAALHEIADAEGARGGDASSGDAERGDAGSGRRGDASATAHGPAALPPLPAAGPMRMRPREAYLGEVETVPWREAVGRVSVDSLAAYPPGIPNVLPGEEITVDVVDFLRAVAASPGGHVRGAADPLVGTMRVLRA